MLSVQALQEADAKGGLNVWERIKSSPCEGQREKEQERLGVNGEWKEGLCRKNSIVLRRFCPGWWGVVPGQRLPVGPFLYWASMAWI